MPVAVAWAAAEVAGLPAPRRPTSRPAEARQAVAAGSHRAVGMAVVAVTGAAAASKRLIVLRPS
jgi:hypothetical protein